MREVQRDRRMRIWVDTPIKGPPHSLQVYSCGIKEPVHGLLMLLLHTATSRA